MSEIIVYSQVLHPACEGRRRINPRFFVQPEAGVAKVLTVGDWPRIKGAYEALGVPVERVDPPPPAAPRPLAPASVVTAVAVAGLSQPLTLDERSKVQIPDDWPKLPWTKPAEGRDLTLRGLASMFADEPVINKAGATKVIEAELRRRANHDPGDPTRADLVAALSAAEGE